MARFVMFASLGSVILFLLTLVVPPSAQAQANALATPIPGSGHDYIHMAGWPSLWVPSRLKAAPPFVVFKGWVPRTLRAKPVHSRTNFEVPTLAKNARVDWIRAKARFELSMLLVRTKTAGQKGAFAHDDYRM